MPTITCEKLAELLERIDRAEIVTLTAETSPRLTARDVDGNKKPKRLHGCKKLATVNGVCNVKYKSCVDRQRAREERPVDTLGNVLAFEANPRAWGRRLPGKPLVEYLKPSANSDQQSAGTLLTADKLKAERFLYLEIKRQRELSIEYRDRRGRRINPKFVTPFLRDRTGSGRQLVEHAVQLRDYRLDHIRQLVLRGTVYDVLQDPSTPTRSASEGSR